MRLNVKTREGMIRAFATTLGPQIWNEQLVTLLLFGSRTRPDLKGGDIDLLLLVDSSILKSIQDKKRSLLTALEKNIGERRIDLLIASKLPRQQSEFVLDILPKAIILWPMVQNDPLAL